MEMCCVCGRVPDDDRVDVGTLAGVTLTACRSCKPSEVQINDKPETQELLESEE